MVIAAIAQASVNRGAVGVRIDTPDHIRAARQRVSVPIIGLWKRMTPGFEVYITPEFHHARAIAQAGADIIALDATARPRPGSEDQTTLIQRIHQELHKPVMADVDTLDGAIAAWQAGADLLGTTLYGYTPATQHLSPPGFALLQTIVQTIPLPCLCEGGLATPEMARHALTLGAYGVVVGTAITGIDHQVQAFLTALLPTQSGANKT